MPIGAVTQAIPWDAEAVKSEDPDVREVYFKKLIKALRKDLESLHNEQDRQTQFTIATVLGTL